MTALELVLWGAIALVVYAYLAYGLAIGLIGLVLALSLAGVG